MGDTFCCSIDFADILNEVNRFAMRRTYEFNLMLVGPNGVGKSALVRSLFQGLVKPRELTEKQLGPELNDYRETLVVNGVKLEVNCIETSNYDHHNIEDYLSYIDRQLNDYYKAESLHSSWNIKDKRVHCCLYLIPPYGKMRLRRDDIECMRALHKRVNLIPVIAKADIFNKSQLEQFKANILTCLREENIQCFEFQYDDKEDEERFKAVKQEAERFPFAIVSADEPTVVAENKKSRWIRETIAGQIDISDQKKCDSNALSRLLLRHCMLDLIESTHVKHYAEYAREITNRSSIRRNSASYKTTPTAALRC